MAGCSGSWARRGRALALGVASLAAVSPVWAGDFSPADCRGISGIARAVVRRVGADTLSLEFRQSFVDWMGPETRCDGPKEITIVTGSDDATYRTIRSELLQLPKPLSLQNAGLRPVVKADAATARSAH